MNRQKGKRKPQAAVPEVWCPYCGEKAKLVKGVEIYPHRKDLAYLNFYSCEGTHFKPHDKAYVGTHKGTIVPLGRLANEDLRKAKSLAHRAFDRIWRDGHMTRRQAYAWLAEQLDLPGHLTHIGMFDLKMCAKVEQIANKYYLQLEFKD